MEERSHRRCVRNQLSPPVSGLEANLSSLGLPRFPSWKSKDQPLTHQSPTLGFPPGTRISREIPWSRTGSVTAVFVISCRKSCLSPRQLSGFLVFNVKDGL